MGSGPRVADDSLGSGRQKVLQKKNKIRLKEIQVLPYICMLEVISLFLKYSNSDRKLKLFFLALERQVCYQVLFP